MCSPRASIVSKTRSRASGSGRTASEEAIVSGVQSATSVGSREITGFEYTHRVKFRELKCDVCLPSGAKFHDGLFLPGVGRQHVIGGGRARVARPGPEPDGAELEGDLLEGGIHGVVEAAGRAGAEQPEVRLRR